MLFRTRRRFVSPVNGTLLLTVLVLLCLGALPPALPVAAEGSRDMTDDTVVTQGYRAFLEWHATATSAGILRQTTIKAYAEPGETIYLGSSAMSYLAGDVIIRGPQDTTPATLWPVDAGAKRCTARSGGNPLYGRIGGRAQEEAGPLPAAGGFIPCVVTAAETTAAGAGVWEFDFISPNPDVPVNNNPSPPLLRDAEWNTAGRAADFQNFTVAAWDVSVRDTDAGDPSGAVDLEIPGRVFANYLALNLGGNAGGSNPADVGLYSQFYIQTDDGYGYAVDMNGIDPFAFIFFGNAEGIVDQAGKPVYRSVQLAGTNATQELNPRSRDNPDSRDITHKIFFDLSGPATDMPASAPSPSGDTWLLRPPVNPPEPRNMSFTGEEGTPGQAGTNPLGGYFSFDAAPNATYNIIIDLSGDGLFGTGNDRTLNGPTDDGANRVYWDGLDGNGLKVPAGLISFSAQIQLFVGEVHFPFIDAENHPNGHRLTRARDAGRPGAPDPSLVYYNDAYNYRGGATYDWSLCAASNTPQPPASYPITAPRCYGQPLDGRSALQGTPSAAAGLTGAHRWSTAAGGTTANGFGDRRLIDTWTYYPSSPIPIVGQITLAEAELSIEKSHAPPQLTPGGPVSYSVVVRNGGPSTAVGARVRDTVPAGVLDVSWTCAVTSGVGSCGDAAGAGNLIETTVDIGPGAVITYSITGTVSPEVEQSLANTATVRRPNDTTDPNLGNNTATDIAPILLSADLELTKSLLTPPPLQANSEVVFSIALRNRGPSRANNVTVTDRLPAGLSLVSAAPSKGTYDPASGLWTVGTMLRDEVAELVVRATWNGTQVTNSAQVTGSDKPDPDSTPGNNDPGEDDQSSVSLPNLVADLELTKAVSAARVNVGQNATFSLVLTNRGPDRATGVRVSDRLPLGLALVRATPSQGSYDQVSGDWAVGALDQGAQATLTLEVTVLSPGSFTNVAQVSGSDQFDPDSRPNNDAPNEDDQGFAPLQGELADLSIGKRVSNATPNINDVITYTVELRNDGPSNATGVEVTDSIPAGLEYVSHSTSQGSYDVATGLWSVGSVPAGGGATLTISARVRSFARLVNVAEITKSDQPDNDSTPGNGDPTEDDYASVPLSPQIADLELTKRANTSRPPLGATVIYTVELTNRGPSLATGVQVTDKLPAGLTYLSHSTVPPTTAYDPFTGIWNVGQIDVGSVYTLTVQARMDGIGPFTNVAEVSDSDQFDPDSTPGNNSQEDDWGTATVSSPAADLSVSKRSSEPRPNAAGEVTYTVGVHNAGPDAATGVVVAEQLPVSSTLLASSTSKGTYAGGSWSVGSLAVGETALLTLTIRVGGPPPYVNIAQVAASDVPDPDSGPGNSDPAEDDYASVDVPSGVIDLELTISAVALPKLTRGALLTVDLVNKGPDDATGVEVENKLPSGLRFVSAAPSQGSYDPATGRWIVGDMPVNGTERLQIAVEIVDDTGAEYVNMAQVTRANEHDIDSTPNNRPTPPPVEDEEDVVRFSLLTPVTLKRFVATATDGGVRLEWETGAEFETLGFYLYRAEGEARATATRITPSMVAARGGSADGASYSFLDSGAAPGRGYSYWLVEVARGGATSEYGPVTLISRPYRVGLPLLR
jgi:uncharacterized repeat protein (TIGR01451 family)